MKVTNTEHTVINGNQSKCRMTQSYFEWRIDEVRREERCTYSSQEISTEP